MTRARPRRRLAAVFLSLSALILVSCSSGPESESGPSTTIPVSRWLLPAPGVPDSTLPLESEVEEAGAQIEENADRVLHVDGKHPEASDDNAGTPESPLATLQGSLDRAHGLRNADNSVKILVHEGTYRESLEIQSVSGSPALAIEATTPGSVVVSGSEIWDEWTPGPDPGTFISPWPHQWGADDSVEPIVGRREMVFIDGEPLRQVLRRSEMAPGSFRVDEEAQVLHIQPFEETDLTESTVEVALRPRLLAADGIHNVSIKGLYFQHAASPFDTSAIEIINSGDIALIQNSIRHNNWTGLGLGISTHVSLIDNTIESNGGGGVGGFRQSDLLLEGNITSFNNWRGVRGDYVGWSIAAVKLVDGTRISIRDHYSVGNNTRGLWLDFDLTDVALERVVLCHNLTDGLMVEAVPGPVDVRDSAICSNGEEGVVVVNAVGVTISGSRICNNEKAGIHFDAEPGGRQIENGSGTIDLPPVADLTIHGNIVNGSPTLLNFHLTNDDWDLALESMSSDLNTWGEVGSAAFRFPGGSGDLEAWRRSTSLDRNSTTSEPGSC